MGRIASPIGGSGRTITVDLCVGTNVESSRTERVDRRRMGVLVVDDMTTTCSQLQVL